MPEPIDYYILSDVTKRLFKMPVWYIRQRNGTEILPDWESRGFPLPVYQQPDRTGLILSLFIGPNQAWYDRDLAPYSSGWGRSASANELAQKLSLRKKWQVRDYFRLLSLGRRLGKPRPWATQPN